MADCFAESHGSLAMTDSNGVLAPRGKVIAKIIKNDDFEYILQLCSEDDRLLFGQPIDGNSPINMKNNNTLEWVYYRDNGANVHIRLTLDRDQGLFLFALSQALFEVNTGTSLEKHIDKDDKQWFMESQLGQHGDTDMVDLDFDFDEKKHYVFDDDEEEEEEEEFYDVPQVPDNEEYRSEDEEEVEEEVQRRGAIRQSSYTPGKAAIRTPAKAAGRVHAKTGKESSITHTGNSSLVSGMAQNRSYVTRNEQIGVFRYNEDGDLTYQNKLKGIRNKEGEFIIPDVIQLHDNDTKMLIIDKDDKGAVHEVDITRGQVIDTWMGDSDMKFKSIAPSEKYAQTTSNNVIVGNSETGLFSLDGRVNTKNKMGENSFFYKDKKVGLETITTTGEGYVAVASANGDIRLFNKIGKGYCKTQLPGLGSKITNVDSTEDGSWLLATCDKYLLVFPLILGNGKTGFEARMGQEKPVPLKLALSPEDLAKYNIKDVKFTPAKFNTGTSANTKEQWIATSIGPWIITWDFDQVKKGKRYAYKIKKTNANIVRDVFRHNHQNELVVAQSDDVFMSSMNTRRN